MDADDVAEWSVPEKVDYIKSRILPADVAEMAGVDIERDKIPSPFNPDDHTPSCHLYDDHWWDYSTGKGGDVIDLYVAYTKKSWGRAVKDLLAGTQSIDADEGRAARRERAAPVDLRNEYFREERLPLTPEWELPGVPRAYMQSLLDDEDLAIVAGRMLIPHWHTDNWLPGVKVRYPTFKASFDGSQYLELYRTTSLPWHAGKCIIMEGESDCWAMESHMIATNRAVDVYALPSGAGTWRDSWLELLEPYSDIYLCFDNDHAGKKALDKVSHAVGLGRALPLDVPPLLNDAREALAQGWRPRL